MFKLYRVKWYHGVPQPLPLLIIIPLSLALAYCTCSLLSPLSLDPASHSLPPFQVLERVHSSFFFSRRLGVSPLDARLFLAEERRRVLAGCCIVFSRIVPVSMNWLVLYELAGVAHELAGVAHELAGACDVAHDPL